MLGFVNILDLSLRCKGLVFMIKQYWIGELFVDISRNQITQLGKSQTLPPKALLVLTHLAENRGQVVSYEELLDKVWPNTIVTPNTLQRNIAQLRKAIGESNNAQSVIKTHAKQGYSLECEVTWTHSLEAETAKEEQKTNTSESAPSSSSGLDDSAYTHSKTTSGQKPTISVYKRYFGILAGVTILFFVTFYIQFQSAESQIELGNLRYITATDDKEFGGTYSPSGKHILFRRYLQKGCINNIWAKTTDTLQEHQLTAELGNYGENSLSADGKTLVFIKQQDCTTPVTQTTCYKLMSIDFHAALSQPQSPKLLLDCQNSVIKKPTWVDNKHIVMLQRNNQHWRLIQYSVEDNSTQSLYENDTRILSYAWSAKQQLFAVTVIKSDGNQYIDMLNSTGEMLSSHQILLPQSAPRHTMIRPQFVPNKQQLIFSSGDNLYTLSYEGQVTLADFQFDEGVNAPYFHPNGKRLLLIKGTYDSDVASLSMLDIKITKPQQADQLTVFARSTKHEDIAKFHPNGETIAFVSARTGSEQVWLQNTETTTLVSNFPMAGAILNMLWDDDGSSLLVLNNLELYQQFLNNTAIKYEFPLPVVDLFHWNQDTQQVIANILVNGSIQFVSIDLDTLDYQLINSRSVMWAAKNRDNTLVFIDHVGRFWQKTDIEDKLLEPLTGQLAIKQRFVVNDTMIYGINKENRLWRYNIASDDFNIMTELRTNIDYITDIQNDELLVTFVIAAKKEVVELSLKN